MLLDEGGKGNERVSVCVTQPSDASMSHQQQPTEIVPFLYGTNRLVSDTLAVHMPWLIHHMTINCNVLMHVTFKETHEKILNQNKNNWRIEVDQQVQSSDWNFSHHHPPLCWLLRRPTR
jgi:hypothetical protein